MVIKTKLYCFADETGQDTKGQLFLVAIVLHEADGIGTIEAKLSALEKESGKNKLKWKKTSNQVKIRYLEELVDIPDLKNSIYYSIWVK